MEYTFMWAAGTSFMGDQISVLEGRIGSQAVMLQFVPPVN